MANIERTYTIPLRREFIKVPAYRRAKRAISTIKIFIEKHMGSDDIKIGKELNDKIWHHGIKNPPGKVRVKTIRDDEDVVTVELEGFEYKTEKVQTKKEEPKSLKEKIESKIGKTDTTADSEQKKATKETKVVEKKVEEKKTAKKPEAEPHNADKPTTLKADK